MFRKALKKFEKLLFRGKIIYDFWSKKKWQLKYEFQNLLSTPSLSELIKMPHRKYLVELIANEKKIESLLEFGCGYGPNLILLRKELGNRVKLSGCDISMKLINENKRREEKRGDKINYFFGDLNWLKNQKKDIFEYVFLDSVSMYLGPKEIKNLFKGLHKITRKKIILTAWQKETDDGKIFFWESESEWIYDYNLICHKLFKVKIKKFPNYIWTDERWKKYGIILHLEPKV